MLIALPMPSAQAVSTTVVISQVYGGGGNSGAVYTHDFVELFNRGTTTVDLTGWSIQYASATGTGNFGAATTQITDPVSLAPGQYLLVQEASNAAVGVAAADARRDGRVADRHGRRRRQGRPGQHRDTARLQRIGSTRVLGRSWR